MAKTKRTVEEAEVTAAAAANSDSKLVTRGSLNSFATKFWDRIKRRYDETFKDAELTDDKKLTFTRVSGTPKEIDLVDYARLTDKSEFKQDVSADNVAILSNGHIGTDTRFTSRRRSLGFRQLTTSAFVDGYVDHIRIYLEGSATENATFKVWAIKKGSNRNADRVDKVIHIAESLEVNSIGEGLTAKKFAIIPIKQAFADETYFIVRCSTHDVEVVANIKSDYIENVVNLNDEQPPDSSGSEINWDVNASGSDTNTAIMYLYGRESIGSLALKLNKVSPDSGLYVKHSETTDTGGTRDTANKVVKLDNDGKLNKNMLPSIAINEYFEINDFSSAGLRDVTYENGDVVVVNDRTNINHGKKYLCIKKDKTASTNSTSDFIELNSKDGSVLSVNEKTGAVTLALETTDNELKLKITGGGTAGVAETSVPIVTEGDINSIIEGLRD